MQFKGKGRVIKSPVQGPQYGLILLYLLSHFTFAVLIWRERGREGGEVDSVLIMLCVFFAVKLERFVY